ncbi:hypothetical protein BKA65DRAFT_609598 [Rhexocercosporidium sp. MPI-PUGE-AT-0058]|nr:hypothetical protein BKA65DRAFT_609598 [Rhexocercosporidium sp. MPI-PUGE-AT-0058]
MPPFSSILASNALINDTNAPQISVFAGGTSGIGKLTIKALVSTGASVKIYLIGRPSAASSMKLFINGLNALNPKAEIIWLEGEISLLADVKRICRIIKNREKSVDLLFLTAGYAPFGPREETVEGLEVVQSLEYYSRVLFTLLLLPLLRERDGGRVVSVLSGGVERTKWADGTMTFDKLASENPGVTFIHSWPGLVNTGNSKRGNPGWLLGWFLYLVLEPALWLFSMSDEVSGQRNLFLSTSAAFGGRGIRWEGKRAVNSMGKEEDGLFLVNYKCDCTPNQKAVSVLREKGQGKIWEHTQEVLRSYL